MTELRELIRKKGTIDGLMALDESQEMTHSEIMDEMGVSNGTIQERLKELKSSDLVEEDAVLGDTGRPQKTYKLTEDGSKRVKKLRELLDE